MFKKRLNSVKTPFWHYLLPPGMMKLKKTGRWIYGLTLLVIVSTIALTFISNKEWYGMALSEDESTAFLTKEKKYGTFVNQTYKGQIEMDGKSVEMYSVVTTTGKYTFLYEGKKENSRSFVFKTLSVHQEAPTQKWIKNEQPTLPSVSLALNQLKDDVGIPKSYPSRSTIETNKGTILYTLVNSDIDTLILNGKELDLPNKPVAVQKRTQKFLDKHVDLIGEDYEEVDYTWEKDKQSFYISSKNGYFKIDEFYNGKVKILKGNLN